MRFLLLSLLLAACTPTSGGVNPSGPTDPTDPTDPDEPDPDPDPDPVDPLLEFYEARLNRTCSDSLAAPRAAILGQQVGETFVPLELVPALPVHAGGQGGYHSDLLVLIEGPGADAGFALDVAVDMSGGWNEAAERDVMPNCMTIGISGYFAPVRLFWWGPAGEPSLEDYCGEDPCDEPWADEYACDDYWYCVDEYEWEGASPNIDWDEITDQTASFTVSVDGVDAGQASDVDLEYGDEELDGG